MVSCLSSAFLLFTSIPGAPGPEQARLRPPIDPQRVQDQDDMTWADYRPIPGRNWADPSLKPERGFKLAVVAIDFPDQPFVITMPKGSDPFGNPQLEPIAREDVPRFYADFFVKPGPVNHGQTINGYWMEQSRGKFGITEVEWFGPYRMPKPIWHYGLNEHGQNASTPGREQARWAAWSATATRSGRRTRSARDVRKKYDAVLRMYAGYDETGVWQEFGEMKFNSKEDIPPEWGNPNPDMPRWIPTRYVEWTSWLAGSRQWGLSSMRQGENSGTITHELGHFAFRLPDLNNNPYVKPYRRVAAGPWDMMDRGSFNGPGGPHRRWVVPPIQGAAMPAGLMVRNRLENKFITEAAFLRLSRDGPGQVRAWPSAEVTARAVDPLPGTFTGHHGPLGRGRALRPDPGRRSGDESAVARERRTTLITRLEVVQRIGYDSFTPDNGVLIAKNKDGLRGSNGGPNGFNSYIWVIDAHPEDINQVDYVKPNGQKVMRTIADYRQLNDALFHAGLGFGKRASNGPTSPTGCISMSSTCGGTRTAFSSIPWPCDSLDGAGPQKRGVALTAAKAAEDRPGRQSEIAFELRTRANLSRRTPPSIPWMPVPT